MTTNQTIDGVPRELRPVLAMILNALDRDAADGKAVRGEMAAELRALLEAPDQSSEIDALRTEVEKWKGIAGRRTAERTEFMNERDDLKAAQPQVQPVAWLGSGVPFAHQQDAIEYASYKDKQVKPLYAEQPAPVVVNSQAMTELRRIFDSNKGADGTLVISKKLAAQILNPSL